MDVVSSDRHTVKPWFAGKTDIAPAVVDMSERGFPLLGGRLDYVNGHSAATLVYGRRLHTINLFVWRNGEGEPADGAFAVRGYSLLHWTNGGLSYWAVSDAATSELEAFREAYTK
jgi:anti-sigma factor RsiW